MTHPKLISDAVFDTTGQFILDEMPARECTIIAKATGFLPHVASITLPADSSRLTLRAASRGEVVSGTATRTDAPLSMVGVSATAIDEDQIVQKQSPPVYEMLRDVSGVAVSNTSRRDGRTGVYTGGGEANLLMVEGIPVNDPGGDFNFANLTITNVDRIVPGPESPVYGSNATAVALQVVSHPDSSEDGIASEFGSSEGGTFSTYRYRSGFSGAIRGLDYSGAPERLRTKGADVNDFCRILTPGNIGCRFNDISHIRLRLWNIGSYVGVSNQVGYGILDRNALGTDGTFVGGIRCECNTDKFSQPVQLGFVCLRDYHEDSQDAGPLTVGAFASSDLFVRVDNLLNRQCQEVLADPVLSRNALAGVNFRKYR